MKMIDESELGRYLDLQSTDGHIVLFCAFRYALGRQSYVVESVIRAMRDAAPRMDANQRWQFVKEIRKAAFDHGLGNVLIDTPLWVRLAADLEAMNEGGTK